MMNTSHNITQLASRLGIVTSSRNMSLVDRIVAPRPAVAFTYMGRQNGLLFTAPPDLRRALTVCVDISGVGQAILHLSPKVLNWLPDDLSHLATLQHERPLAQALMLELALLEPIELLEAALGAEIRISPRPLYEFEHKLGLRVDGQDLGFDCGLELDTSAAQWVADKLDQSIPSHGADLSTVPVGLVIWSGRQFLSISEIEKLHPGDLIMIEQGPMLVLAGENLAAAASLTSSGLFLQSEFEPRPAQKPWAGMIMIDFVIGYAELPLSTIATLGTGSRLPIATYEGTVAEIAVAGRVLGRGEVIAVGAGRAVRITHLRHDALVTLKDNDEPV